MGRASEYDSAEETEEVWDSGDETEVAEDSGEETEEVWDSGDETDESEDSEEEREDEGEGYAS